METYLVGGAVRDELLGLPVVDRDWVVVGATVDDMLALDFRQVGRDFPVFLHPESSEEYALARTERKSAPGHRGFDVHSDPSVTLEQDLSRRDLTINAIARDADGTLIDPYGGLRDLEDRRLRHVSPAFSEDPLRVLRVARFRAQLAAHDFEIDPDTLALMQAMVAGGELDTLPAERVWGEFEKALATPAPARFIAALANCGAADWLLPGLVDIQAAGRRLDSTHGPFSLLPEQRFAVMFYTTAPDVAETVCTRLKPPRRYAELATLSADLGARVAAAGNLVAAAKLEVLQKADALRRPDRFRKLVELVAATTDDDASIAESWEQALSACEQVDVKDITAAGFSGEEIGRQLQARRLAALEALV